MEIKELLESVQIEGAGNGDVVFISTAPGMSGADFVKFAEAFRSHADNIRATDTYFPSCIVLPPGVTVEVARAEIEDRVEVSSNLLLSGEIQAASPDAGVSLG